MKKYSSFAIVCIIVSGIFLGAGYIATAAEDDVEDDLTIEMSSFPHSILFKIENMKPGDTATRTLTISNTGTGDFVYNVDSRKTGGSELLYEGLVLHVADTDGVLYEGSLAQFNGLEQPRQLASSAEEDLTLRVEFPFHLGNEYQGLAVATEIVLGAEGRLLLPDEENGRYELPETATNMYNYLLIASILVLIGGLGYYYYRKKENLSNK